MRPPGMKGDRDLVGIERSLGLRSVRGISRQANKDAPPIRSLLEGIRIIAQAYVTRSNGEIRSSQVLKDDAHDLLEQYGPEIWPGPESERPAWLEEPSTTNFDGKYPQHRYYTDPADREFLNNTFYQLVVEKCCNYHDNQLQKHRRSSAKHNVGQDHSASATPRQGDYADEAENSETEFVTAHAPPSWPAVNDPVTRRLHPAAPPPAISPPTNHSPEFRPHGLPGVYLFGSNEHLAADTAPGAMNDMSPIPDQRRPSQVADLHVQVEHHTPAQERDQDGDEVLPDAPAPVNGDDVNGEYANGYKRKRSASLGSEVTSKRSRTGSIYEAPKLIVKLKANPDELLRISKRSRKTLYNNNFLDYYTRDSSPEETSSRRSVRSLRSERQSTIHSTPGPELKKPVIEVKQYRDPKGKWYEVDGLDSRPEWAIDERTVTRPAPQERRRSAWVKRHGPISPSSVNALSEIGNKTRSDDAFTRNETEDENRPAPQGSNPEENQPEKESSVNGRKGSHTGPEEVESAGKSGLLSPSKSPGPLPHKKADVHDNAHHLLNAFGDQAQPGKTAQQNAGHDKEHEHEHEIPSRPAVSAAPVAPIASLTATAPRKTSSSPFEPGTSFRPSEPHQSAAPDLRTAPSEQFTRFAPPEFATRSISSSDGAPLQHVFKARNPDQPAAVKSRVSSVSDHAPPLSIVRARNPEEDERAQARLGAFRPSVQDGQFIQFALPQQAKETVPRQEDERIQARPPAHKQEEQHKASATPEMTSTDAMPTPNQQPKQPKRSIKPAAGAGAPPPAPNYATPKALVDEILGNLAQYPTVQHMLATFPTLSRIELENLRLIVSNDLAARNDWRALQRYLRAEIMYGSLETVDFRILQQYVYSSNGNPPPSELASLFSKRGGPTRPLPSNSIATPRQQPAVPSETKPTPAMKPEIVRPLTIQSVAPVMPTNAPAPPPVPVPSQAQVPTPTPAPTEAKRSEPPDSKGIVTGNEDESLRNTNIEINWGHPSIQFNDYMEMQDFENCSTATEWFGRIEAKIPSELAKESRPFIREIRLKPLTELKVAGHMPRFLRDDGGVRAGWKKLVKILRAQPLGTEAELEFLVIWG